MSDRAQAFDAVYDVVVVGGGGSGLMAAVQAAHNGDKVAVLEKMPTTGGSSAMAEGHAAFESSEQKKRGIDVRKDDVFMRYMTYSHWRADPEVVAAFVDNADTTLEKLKDEGVVYEAVKVTAVDQPDELVTWHIPEGEMGRVCQILETSARRMGADIFLETAAEQILMEDGHVAGVVAKDSDGNAVRLGARAIIIASGGFAANPEMIAKYSRFASTERMMSVGSPGNTGDGIRMALEVGADTFGLGVLMMIPAVRDKTITSHVMCAATQPYLWVNRDGKRFANEIVGLNFADAGNVVASQPGGFSFTVLDRAAVQHLADDGCEVGLGEFVLTGTKLTHLADELEQDAEQRKVGFKADTIEGLAKEMGVDPEAFAATVAEYNEACHTGTDARHRKAKHLLAVEQAPFYAIKVEPGILVSIGGIKIDGSLRVIGEDGRPIPGLYAVGVDAGGMYGDAYVLQVPGTSCGFSFTGGWLAADHAHATITQAAGARA